MTFPSGANDWLSALAEINPKLPFCEEQAALIRILASQKDYAVMVASGPGTLNYVPWLRDGMSMNNRLIIHQTPEYKQYEPSLGAQLAIDIRLAAHFQEVDAFTTDIAHHKVDMVLLDWTAEVQDVENWLSLMSDFGLLICLASAGITPELKAACAEEFFLTEQSGNIILIARKGIQHRAKRRGRRR